MLTCGSRHLVQPASELLPRSSAVCLGSGILWCSLPVCAQGVQEVASSVFRCGSSSHLRDGGENSRSMLALVLRCVLGVVRFHISRSSSSGLLFRRDSLSAVLSICGCLCSLKWLRGQAGLQTHLVPIVRLNWLSSVFACVVCLVLCCTYLRSGVRSGRFSSVCHCLLASPGSLWPCCAGQPC